MTNSSLTNDIISFIDERISIFLNKKNNFNEDDNIYVLTYIIPISHFKNQNSIDVDVIFDSYKRDGYVTLRPIQLLDETLTMKASPNSEGLQISWDNNAKRLFYNQIFRNAVFESCGEIIQSTHNQQRDSKFINDIKFLQDTKKGVERILNFFKTEGISEPVIVSIHLFNIKDCYLGISTINLDPIPEKLTINHLNLGNIEIQSYELGNSLEPIFKILYNTFGRTKPK